MIAYEVQRASWVAAQRRRDTIRGWVITGVVAALAVGVVWGVGVIQQRHADELLRQREHCEALERETILVRNIDTGVMHYRCGALLRLIVANDD